MRSNEVFSNNLDSINYCVHLDLVGGVIMDWMVGVSYPASCVFWYSLFKQREMKIKITGIDWFLLEHELIYNDGKTSKIWFRLTHRKENLDLLNDMDIKLVHTIKCIEE